MAVRQRGNRFQADFRFKGKRYRKNCETFHEAELWIIEAQAALMRGKDVYPIDNQKNAVQSVISTYEVTYRRYWQSSKSEKTQILNGNAILNYFGPETPISKISQEKIDGFILSLRHQGNSPATINTKLATLSKMLTYAHELGHIKRKPRIQRLREVRTRTRYLTQAEETRILDYFDSQGNTQMRDFCIVAIDTGMRVGELLSLQEHNLDGDWIRLWQTKSGEPRSIPLTQRAKEALERGLFDHLKQHQVNEQWNQMKQALGLEDDKEFVPHCMRHTFCSRLVQRGVSLATIQKLAGHATIQMTIRYAHLSPDNLTDAIRVLE